MATTVYKSTDSGAPALNNAAGSLIALLDAILVDGYGSKAPCGWTKEYTATNKAAYKISTAHADSTGCYLRVDNSVTRTANAKMFKTMSDIDTGTDPAPTVAQSSTGVVIDTSTSASNAVWCAVGDGRTLYLNIKSDASQTTGGTSARQGIYIFGDFESQLASNGYAYICCGISSTSSTTNYTEMTALTYTAYKTIGRDSNGSSGAAQTRTVTLYNQPSGYLSLASNPHQDTGQVIIYPALIETTRGIIGQLRGAYSLAQTHDGTIFSTDVTNPIDPGGPAMVQMSTSGSSTLNGGFYVTSGDWDAS